MARNLGPVCRMCRREGLKLFLKGERCYTDKCAIERRNYQGFVREGLLSDTLNTKQKATLLRESTCVK